MTMSSNSTTMLKKLLDVVAHVSELAVIRFAPEGAHLQTMDPSRVCLVDVRLPSSWFDNYKCVAASHLSTSLVMLVKMLGCAESGQTALLHTCESKGEDAWNLVLFGGGDGTFRKEFSLPLYNLEDDLMDIPAMEADVDFTLNAAHWAATLDQLSMFGETIGVACDDAGTTLTASETTAGTKMSCLIGLDDVGSYEACEETIKLHFAAKLLHQTSAARHASSLGPIADVAVHFTEDRPIDIEYQLGDGGIARFLVAPRMEDD